MNKYKLGLWAELFLALLLILKGYTIVKRRYKTKVGEIDLIAKKRDELLVCEVKAAKYMEATSELVSVKQKNRIEKALNIFLSVNNKYIDYNISHCIFFYKNIFNHKLYK
jgi:putative endonuclease